MEIPSERDTEDAPTPHRYTTPLDQWRQLPEWKRAWFESLSVRDLDMIFPSDQARLDRWLAVREFSYKQERFWSSISRTLLTAVVMMLASAFGALLLAGYTVWGKK